MTSPFEKALTHAKSVGSITQDGIDFLEMSLNPFPNNEIRAVGYPDGTRGRSIVRVVNNTYSISAPAGLSGAYDLHVFSFPEVCEVPLGLCDSAAHTLPLNTNAWTESDGITPFKLGLFNIILVPAGSPSLPSTSGGTFLLPAGSQVWRTNYKEYCQGPTRLVAGGFKALNTSADLYRSGSSLMYRRSSQATDAVLYGGGTSAVDNTPEGAFPVRQFAAPPGSLQAAATIPGCVTGLAAEGAYMPLIMGPIGPARPCRYNTTLVMPTDEPNTTCPTWITSRYNGAGATYNRTVTFDVGGNMPCVKEAASDICGVYFAGCAQESTFTITTRAVLQTFPTITDPDLTLARESPENDPVALDIARRIALDMHVAGVAASNPTGSWWRSVCQAGMAATVLIPNPLYRSAAQLAIKGTTQAALTLGSSGARPVAKKSGNANRRRGPA